MNLYFHGFSFLSLYLLALRVIEVHLFALRVEVYLLALRGHRSASMMMQRTQTCHAGSDVARINKVRVRCCRKDRASGGKWATDLPKKTNTTSYRDDERMAVPSTTRNQASSHPVKSHKTLSSYKGLNKIRNPQLYSQFGAVDRKFRSSLPAPNTFRCTKTGQVYQVNADITIQSKNVCYLITILETGEQYVGETSRIFRIRANEHYNHNISTQNNTPLALAFKANLRNRHPLINIIIQPIDQGKTKKDITTKEAYWIRELHTLYPYGLNTRLGCCNWDQPGMPSGLSFNGSKKNKRSKTRKPYRPRMDRRHHTLSITSFLQSISGCMQDSSAVTLSTDEYKTMNRIIHSVPHELSRHYYTT